MILLLGSSGYIGSEFVRQLGPECRVIKGKWRYRNFDDMRRSIAAIKPELVINCAAFVMRPSVDLNETEKAETMLGNLVTPVVVRDACAAQGIPMLHISTGCLYNGGKDGKGWTEEDPPQLTYYKNASCGVYVGTKQLAEQVVSEYPMAYNCRLRLPFDQFDDERNYLSKLQRYAKVYSSVNSLTHRGEFVRACLELWKKRAPFGIYNMTNPGALTGRQICEMIRDYLGSRKFEFWEEKEFMEHVAKTPKSNCVLNTDKLRSVGIFMTDVRAAVADSLRNWVAEK